MAGIGGLAIGVVAPGQWRAGARARRRDAGGAGASPRAHLRAQSATLTDGRRPWRRPRPVPCANRLASSSPASRSSPSSTPNCSRRSPRPQRELAWRRGSGSSARAMRATRCMWSERAGSSRRQLGHVLPRARARAPPLGELALITGEARAASIRAARDCELVEIGQANFQRLLEIIARALARAESAARPSARRVAGREVRGAAARVNHLRSRPRRHRSRPELAPRSHRFPPAAFARAVCLAEPRCRRKRATRRLRCAPGPSGGRQPASWCSRWTRARRRMAALLRPASRPHPHGRGARGPIEGELDPALREADLVACDVQPGSGALADIVELIEPIEHHPLRIRTEGPATSPGWHGGCAAAPSASCSPAAARGRSRTSA